MKMFKQIKTYLALMFCAMALFSCESEESEQVLPEASHEAKKITYVYNGKTYEYSDNEEELDEAIQGWADRPGGYLYSIDGVQYLFDTEPEYQKMIDAEQNRVITNCSKFFSATVIVWRSVDKNGKRTDKKTVKLNVAPQEPPSGVPYGDIDIAIIPAPSNKNSSKWAIDIFDVCHGPNHKATLEYAVEIYKNGTFTGNTGGEKIVTGYKKNFATGTRRSNQRFGKFDLFLNYKYY